MHACVGVGQDPFGRGEDVVHNGGAPAQRIGAGLSGAYLRVAQENRIATFAADSAPSARSASSMKESNPWRMCSSMLGAVVVSGRAPTPQGPKT